MKPCMSFIIPCYNSEEYLHRAVESVLGFDHTEIILVDDGSSRDRTPEICDEYAEMYPHIHAVHQENGGHGAAVMQGISLATGEYCKVVDSDDWLDRAALKRVLQELKELDSPVDMCIANYVYEHVDYKSKPIRYTKTLPQSRVCSWQDVGRFKLSQYLLMHAVIYRRELLDLCKLSLPKHTFYVDNIFVYQPLPFVETIYYVNADLYRYHIGREDQSVNQEIMKQRVDQQIHVTRTMIAAHDPLKISETQPRLGKYMKNKIAMMMTISSVFLLLHKNREALLKKKNLWQFLAITNPWLYRRVRWRSIALFTMLPGRLGRAITLGLYRIIRRIFKFN